ncbi:Uncharacterised protein [Serratia fonticola]|nr:Uncharacterised protein [Serratia fonticola]CAI0783791.1 Uncharacterised protein [Serratia fonticola]CAI1514940.1 Uncharacterised protein [Serratia fonticola]CAI1612675.1 Uncharacterised protein [Serratia fonticola]CAI1837180.1 Uncharacterised protein [Serratia fonticola]
MKVILERVNHNPETKKRLTLQCILVIGFKNLI